MNISSFWEILKWMQDFVQCLFFISLFLWVSSINILIKLIAVFPVKTSNQPFACKVILSDLFVWYFYMSLCFVPILTSHFIHPFLSMGLWFISVFTPMNDPDINIHVWVLSLSKLWFLSVVIHRDRMVGSYGNSMCEILNHLQSILQSSTTSDDLARNT